MRSVILNRTVGMLVITAMAVLDFPLFSQASDPPLVVSFDTPLAVSCKEVARSPQTKTVIATFTFSIRQTSGYNKVDDVEIEIESPERLIRVSDFLPQTTTVTDIVDGEKKIVIKYTKGSASISTIKGKVEAEVKGGTSQKTTSGIELEGRAESQQSENTTIDVTYKQLAPRELLLASGTLNRGHGVFFKLKRTSQHEIEGQHKFVCLFDVVPSWRCDYLRGRCHSGSSNADFIIGVHIDDDATAKSLIENAATIHPRMTPLQKELADTRGALLFPYLGLGSKAAEIDRKLSVVRSEYEKTLHDARLLNLQVDSISE